MNWLFSKFHLQPQQLLTTHSFACLWAAFDSAMQMPKGTNYGVTTRWNNTPKTTYATPTVLQHVLFWQSVFQYLLPAEHVFPLNFLTSWYCVNFFKETVNYVEGETNRKVHTFFIVNIQKTRYIRKISGKWLHFLV